MAINATAQNIENNASFTEEELTWIAEHPVLKATNEMDWAPIDFVRSGEPAGFSIDYLNLIASKAGFNIEYVNGYTWTELVSLLKNKEIDIAHSLAINSDREEYLNFTDAYINLPMVYYGRNGSQPIKTIDDLKNLKIGAVKDWTSTDAYRVLYPNLNIIEYETLQDALEGLSKGETDTVSTILPSAEYIIPRNFITGIEVIGDGFLKEIEEDNDLHLAARNDEPLLHSILTKAMNMVTEEEYNAISRKWLNSYPTSKNIGLTVEELKWISEHPVITSTNEMEWAPIDFVQNNEPQGFSVDYLNLVAEKIGFKVEFVNGLPWHKLLDLLRDKKINLAQSIIETPERSEYLNFTKPYLDLPWVYFGRKGSEIINNLDDLKDRKIGIVIGSVPWDIYKKNYSYLNLIEYSSSIQAFKELSAGRIDVYAEILPIGNYTIKQNFITGLEVIGQRFFPDTNKEDQIRLAARKDWPILISILEKGMDAISPEELMKISTKWGSERNSDFNIGLTREEKNWLIDNSTIKVAVDPTLVPIDMIDENGEMKGISGAFLDKISNILNVKFEWVGSNNWNEAVEMVTSGEAHIFSAISPTPERKQILNFTDETISMSIMIFGRKTGNPYASLENLSGYKIAQMSGFAITEKIRNNYPNIEIIEVTTSEEALKLVATGQADAHLSNIPVASYHIIKEGLTNISVIGETPYKDSNAIGIPKTLPLLASSMQKAMKSLTSEDKAEISKNWLALNNEEKINYTVIMQIFGIAAIIIASILLWVFSLRREITRRQLVEQELLKSQELAEAANKTKSAFLANMSHEIRTPLNSIIGFTELVKSEVYGKVEGDQNKEYLGIVETSSRHLLALINDILDLSKVAAGQIEIYHEFMDVDREITNSKI